MGQCVTLVYQSLDLTSSWVGNNSSMFTFTISSFCNDFICTIVYSLMSILNYTATQYEAMDWSLTYTKRDSKDYYNYENGPVKWLFDIPNYSYEQFFCGHGNMNDLYVWGIMNLMIIIMNQ